MGFGRPPAEFGEQRLAGLRGSFGPSLRLLAGALSAPLDSVEAVGEVATARHTTRIAAGTLPVGTMAAQRITVSGLRKGQPLLRFRANWYCTTDLDPAWDLRATGWHMAVEGTHRSTSTCASPCRSIGWPRCPPATPPTAR